MMNISKSAFCESIESIEDYLTKNSDFSKCISDYSDSYFFCNIGEKMLISYINLLVELTGCTVNKDFGDTISWWLFEDVEKFVEIDGIKIDVSTPDKLYDYIEQYEQEEEQDFIGD